jgi:peptidoglycan/LPS O-acetylase OafA/YrhL
MKAATPASANAVTVPPGIFRLILAYLVVLSHFSNIALGIGAVYLFFMLSGYWIRQMWDREYSHTDAPYVTFVVSRAWRLFPVYYAALVLWIVAKAFLRAPRLGLPRVEGFTALHFYFSHLFLLGYATLPNADKLLHPVWSLDIELQFYLVAPLIIVALSRRPSRSWQRLSIYGIAALGVAAFIILYNGPAGWSPQNAFLPMFLLFFLIGLQAAQAKWEPSSRLVNGGLICAALVAMGCIAVPGTRELLSIHKIHGPLADYNAIANMILALLLAPYAMATVRKRGSPSSRFAKLDRMLGNLSYEVYLLHPIVVTFTSHYFGYLPRYVRAPYSVGAMLAVLPFSWIVYYVIDRPIDRARTAWVKSRRSSVKQLPQVSAAAVAAA